MREAAPASRPPHWIWSWSGLIFTLALTTSIGWYLFWVVMASVELDIKHIVNWYFFARFNLTTVPQTYEGLERVGYWMPLFVFATFLCSRLVCPCKTYLNKVPPVSSLIMTPLWYTGQLLLLHYRCSIPLWFYTIVYFLST